MCRRIGQFRVVGTGHLAVLLVLKSPAESLNEGITFRTGSEQSSQKGNAGRHLAVKT